MLLISLMKKLEAGTRILIKIKQGKEESGIVIESYEPGIILLKLNSGYNIGIKKRDIKSVKILEKPEKAFKNVSELLPVVLD